MNFPELNVVIPSRPRNAPYYWKSIKNQKSFFDNLANKLGKNVMKLVLISSIFIISRYHFITILPGVHKLSDWYRISIRQVQENGGMGLLSSYRGSLLNALKTVYPDFNWTPYRFADRHQQGRSIFSKNQYVLFQCVQSVSSIGHNTMLIMCVRYFLRTLLISILNLGLK